MIDFSNENNRVNYWIINNKLRVLIIPLMSRAGAQDNAIKSRGNTRLVVMMQRSIDKLCSCYAGGWQLAPFNFVAVAFGQITLVT